MAVSAVKRSTLDKTECGSLRMVDPRTDREGYVAIDVMVIDPAIKAITPYYGMLVLPGEERENHLQAVDAKGEFRNDLHAIWSKYPVVSETRKGDTDIPPMAEQ